MPHTHAGGTARRVEPFVHAVAGIAAVVYGLAIAVLLQLPMETLVSPWFIGGTALVVGAFAAFQLWGFEFEWRGHRITTNLEEALVFAALLFLPGPTAVVAIAIADLPVQAWRARALIKGVFNVAHDILAVATAWVVFEALLLFGEPPLLAAGIATVVYVTTSNVLLAIVFSRLEGVNLFRVIWERFAATTALATIIGITGGLAVYALLEVHPLALLALLPFIYTLKRNTVLASRADRELSVHRRLAEVSLELVGTSDLDTVADRVLSTCGRVLAASRATVRVDAEAANGRPHVWTREFETGSGGAGMVVDLPGPDGRSIGELTVHPRIGSPPFGDMEQALGRVVAGQAASAVLNARALAEIEEAREQALAQHERLAKQEKLSTLGTLVANVAHEVGNPVTYLGASLELTLTEVDTLLKSKDPAVRASAERLKADLASARKGAERLREITESLKTVARQGPQGFKRTDLNELAKDVANVVRVGFPRNVQLDLRLSPRQPLVNANPGELTQVVLNLVKNAAEALGREPGWVRVETRVEDDRVFLAVEDNGPGIPDDVKARLFEPFFTTKEKGTGLGLNISRRIVQNHRGDLEVVSRLGEGTTFTLALPSALHEGAPPAQG